MRQALKWIGIVLGGLIGLIVVLALGLYFVGNGRMTRTYDIQPEAVPIPTGAAAIEDGRRWASATGCTGCHGDDLSGTVLLDDATLGYIPTPNLTPGEGGAGSEFTDADWVLAIRHGIDPHEGRALLGMPSANYYYMSDEDLGELIAYLKSLPPVENDLGEMRPTFLTRILIAVGAFGEAALPAEAIDHAGARPVAPSAGATVEYGDYLVRVAGCRDCHGQELAGGQLPEPGAPPGPNITPGGELPEWTGTEFVTAARTGVVPEEHRVEDPNMPWKDFGSMTDDELRALWLYLQSLPARASAIERGQTSPA